MYFSRFVRDFTVTNLLFLCLSVMISTGAWDVKDGVTSKTVVLSEHDRRALTEDIKRYTLLLTQREVSVIDRAAHYAKRGVAYMRLGQNERALSDFDESVLLHPYLLAPYMSQAQIYVGQAKYMDALRALEKAGELSRDATVFGAKTLCLLQIGRYTKALSEARSGLELYPDDARLLMLRSLIHERMGQEYKAAIDQRAAKQVDAEVVEVFDRVLGNTNTPSKQTESVAPDYNELYEQAIILFDAHRFSEALPMLSSVIKGLPERRAPVLYHARACMAVGHYSRAVDDLDELLDAVPGNVSLLWLRAQALYGASRYRLARKDCEAILRIQPADGEAKQLLERMRLESGTEQQ